MRAREFCISVLCSCLCAAVSADHPKEIIVIGDSLSDCGNSRPSLDKLPHVGLGDLFTPATNGTTWPVFLAQSLGAKRLNASSQGGTNYAYVGALTSGYLWLFPNPTLTEQVQGLPSKTDKNAPVFVLGGANDIFFAWTQGWASPGRTAAEDMGHILDTLHHKHYKTLIAINLPDIGKVPSAGANAASYTSSSLLFNDLFKQELKQKKYPVIAIDLFSLFERLITDPTAFGLNNATTSPDPTELFGQPMAGFAFWYDGTHPSQFTHQILADYIYSVLSAAESYSMLTQMPFGALRSQRASLHQQLPPVQVCHELNQLYPFVSGDYRPLLSTPVYVPAKGLSAQSGDVSVGFTDRVSESWTLGLAGSYALGGFSSHVQENKYRFDFNAGILSLFAGFARDHGYLNAIANVAWLDYEHIKRQFYSGPYLNRAHGDTNGIDYDAELYGAYYLKPSCTFKTGPLLKTNYQRAFVKGYRESGADFGNLRYRSQASALFSTGLGWEVWLHRQIHGIGLTTDISLTANEQWLQKKRLIYFNEVSLPDTHGAWPVRMHRNTFASGEMHVSARFKSRLIASLGYSCSIGTFHMSEQTIIASLTMPLGKRKPLSDPCCVDSAQ